MLTSYFRIALRYLLKTKVYSFINIAGLSLSLACAMLMVLYTKDEFSFDRFHKDASLIHQIAIDVRLPNGNSMDKIGATGLLQGPRFTALLPEIDSYLRVAKTYKDVKVDGDIQSQVVLLADSNFFDMFTFAMLRGDASTALRQPNNVVITQDAAVRYFGTEDALNKILYFENEGKFMPYVVSGVAANAPQNSSVQFEIILPLIVSADVEQLGDDNWVMISLNTFVKLRPGSDATAVGNKMQKIFEVESKEAMDRVRKFGFDQTFYHRLVPLTEGHLGEEFPLEGSMTNQSDPLYSYILSVIAMFILAIACINFINLTIARSVKRSREIGVRKVVGAARKQLVMQFLGESFMLCGLSFIGAFFLVEAFLPSFNVMLNKQLSFSYLLDARLIAIYILLFILTGLAAGFYPALVLSGYSPVQTLYNQFRLAGKNYLQRGLVVFQFSLATIMIVGTAMIYSQFNYLTTKDLGYDPSHTVTIPKRDLSVNDLKLFRHEVMKNPNIVSVSGYRHGSQVSRVNGDDLKNFVLETIDDNYFGLQHIAIAEGRNFSSSFPSDSSRSIIVNEAFVKMAGWTNPIGEVVNSLVENEPDKDDIRHVVGVVKNYHFESLKKVIAPQAFIPAPYPNAPYKSFVIRVKPGSEANSLAFIERTFKKLFIMNPFTFQFTDEENFRNYQSESRWKLMILASAVVTIFIAGMGLFGLSILTAERRLKEVGIRKVMGASVKMIVMILSRDFLSLVGVSMIIAMPLAYYLSIRWLESYPYRMEVGPWIFISASMVILLIALVTTSYQSIKAALMNPVETLRSE